MTPAELASARATLRLTQAQLAPLLGYGDKSRVSEIERGSERPSAAVTLLLRAYLDGYRPNDWPAAKTG